MRSTGQSGPGRADGGTVPVYACRSASAKVLTGADGDSPAPEPPPKRYWNTTSPRLSLLMKAAPAVHEVVSRLAFC